MFRLSVPISQTIAPKDPFTRIEPVVDCDGSECGCAIYDHDGNLIELPPHFHLVESEPGAWTRKYAMGGELPG